MDKRGNASGKTNPVYINTMDSSEANTIPLFTLGPQIQSIGSNEAVIEFNTNLATIAIIEYGETISYGQSITISQYNTEHQVLIGGLNSGVQYHYQVTINNYNNTGPTQSGDLVFTTD